jgi:hypothetical protein
MESIDEDGRIILKLIPDKQNRKIWTELILFMIMANIRLMHKPGNETIRFYKMLGVL